ncbi:MAG: VWA domain-containing protein [Bacteroidetes bacterium]|nr:VWA domain-containing protein [Bacteroidota bacterium]
MSFKQSSFLNIEKEVEKEHFMPQKFLILISITWLMVFVLPCHAQIDAKTQEKYAALNRYVNFSNEGIHILWAVHQRLETLNQDMNAYLMSEEKTPIVFSITDVIHNFNYFGVLQGVCAKSYAVTDPQVNIRKLYEETSKQNASIPQETLIQLNRHRDDMMYLLVELLSLSDTLEKYTARQQYTTDAEMQKGYRILRRCVEIYNEFQVAKNKLAEQVNQTTGPAIPELKDLEAIIYHSNQIILGVRSENGDQIVKHINLLEKAIQTAEANKESNKENLKKLGLYYHKENMGYTNMIQYAQQMITRSREFFERPMPDPDFRMYPQSYYHYNERLLALYNHHKYGIIAYYNRFIGFANITLVKYIEEAPLFYMLSPQDIIKQNQELVAEKESNLEFDEIPNMDGAAANNLIFLLDVSASMAKPEKLTLLKDALRYLLGLLRPEDFIAIVTYSGDSRIVLDATSARQEETILQAINSIRSSGRTNIKKGIRQAYKVAEDNFIPGGNNRIILASDGAFDITGSMSRTVENSANRDIVLSVFLFGKKEASRTAEQLQKLSEMGQGNYFHITPENAEKVLLKEAKAVRKQR